MIVLSIDPQLFNSTQLNYNILVDWLEIASEHESEVQVKDEGSITLCLGIGDDEREIYYYYYYCKQVEDNYSNSIWK